MRYNRHVRRLFVPHLALFLGVQLCSSALAQGSPRGTATTAPAGSKGKRAVPKPPADGAAASQEQATRPAEPAACPAQDCAACPEADRALLRAITWAFEPAPEEIRVLAVEDLGLLADERALDVLAGLLLDPNPRIGFAALRAVRSIQAPRAEEILQNVVRVPRLNELAKEQALEALAFQRTPSAREFLESVRDDREGRYGARLASHAKGVLQYWADGAPPPPPRNR